MHDFSAPAPLHANVEQLLTSLAGVVSAHVIAAPDGALGEIHILAAGGLHPKQVVRNVESALSAGLGIEVDRRIISVAQLRDGAAPAEADPAIHAAGMPAPAPRPEPAAGPRSSVFPRQVPDDPPGAPARPSVPASTLHAPHRNGPRPAAGPRRVILSGYETRLDASRQASCHVSLRAGPDEFRGEGRGPDTPRGRADAAATAVFAALAAARGKARFGLEGVSIVDIGGRRFVLVAARALYDRRPVALTGAAHLDGSPEEATILASLQAVNRWQPPGP